MKYQANVALLVLTVSWSSWAAPQTAPLITGFECADEVKEIIHLIGRGDDPKQFIAQDVQTELSRQQPGSVLTKLHCEGSPELKAATSVDYTSGEKVLSRLSVSFPVQVSVEVNGETVEMAVDQLYLAENLDQTEGRKVTQKFIVK
ncbi:hypothetical protein [Bowmanella yangjiangensis]|uniref:Uncharacterized protein n=1 Tax=Bowmanella yangjiangensis TaxID=2811230 RepID=A0ABS3CTP0_9ALTE|nr:hypothetical protein [Bowmanella yangjiangensis]MBN7820430.1 hypothetical protein [Bowmanella yangjiangensis]